MRHCLILAALILVLGPPSIWSQPNPNTERKTAPGQISFVVTVANKKGEYFHGLTPANFKIQLDKVPATVVSASDKDAPTSIAILFDASASVGDPGYQGKRKALIEGLEKFIETSNAANEYFVMGFNKQPQLLLDWSGDSKKIIDVIASVEAQGNTAFFDACYLGIEKLQRSRYEKRAMIIISDGLDNSSHYSFNELRESLKDSDVLVYSVNLSSDNSSGTLLGLEGQSILNEISEASGGMTFYKKENARLKAGDAEAVFRLIAGELRSQYSVVVMPPRFTAGKKWHKVKVRIESPANASRENRSLTARTRLGYFSH